MAYSLQGTARPSLAPRAARAPAARRAAIVASASRSEEAARSAVAGALSLLVAASPLVVAPASFAAASADAIAALEKESAARLSSCTTEECRTVINALNAKKMAKLTGAPPVKAAPAKKAAPKPAPALVAKPTPPPVAKPAPAPAAKPAGPTPAAVKAAADKKAAEKKAAEKAAAEKKKKAEKAAKKSSGGTNPLFYTVSFVGKVAFAAGALAAPFIFLKKEEIIVDESGAIDTEKAISTLKGAATGVVDSLPNKDTVVLYAIGGLVALAVTDGIINLPLLNVLVGAPVQILGFITALLLGKRYLADGGDAGADAKALALKLNAAVPEGLPKPLAPETEADWSR